MIHLLSFQLKTLVEEQSGTISLQNYALHNKIRLWFSLERQRGREILDPKARHVRLHNL